MASNKEKLDCWENAWRSSTSALSAWWFLGSRAEGTENKVEMVFLGKNYTQIRTALHKIAFSRIRTSVLKKNLIVFLRIRFCVVHRGQGHSWIIIKSHVNNATFSCFPQSLVVTSTFYRLKNKTKWICNKTSNLFYRTVAAIALNILSLNSRKFIFTCFQTLRLHKTWLSTRNGISPMKGFHISLYRRSSVL